MRASWVRIRVLLHLHLKTGRRGGGLINQCFLTQIRNNLTFSPREHRIEIAEEGESIVKAVAKEREEATLQEKWSLSAYLVKFFCDSVLLSCWLCSHPAGDLYIACDTTGNSRHEANPTCHHMSHHNSTAHSYLNISIYKAGVTSRISPREVGGVCIIILIAQKRKLRLGED